MRKPRKEITPEIIEEVKKLNLKKICTKEIAAKIGISEDATRKIKRGAMDGRTFREKKKPEHEPAWRFKICVVCGNGFMTRAANRFTCSKACSVAYRKAAKPEGYITRDDPEPKREKNESMKRVVEIMCDRGVQYVRACKIYEEEKTK